VSDIITARIAESRRLEKAATPIPWAWQDGWNEDLPKHGDDYDCAKYADLRLVSGTGTEQRDVIPVRVDHYHYEVDFDPESREAIYGADRALIARMRNEYAALLDVVEAASKLKAEALSTARMQLRGLGQQGKLAYLGKAAEDVDAALAAYARAGGAQ